MTQATTQSSAEAAPATTVYFDGSCPLCRREIDLYKRLDKGGRIQWHDVSANAPDCADLSREQAMARFHVQDEQGQLLSGARAFVAVWGYLPGWRHLARFAHLPGVTPLLELGYRLFLPIRPWLQKGLRRAERSRS